MAPIPPRCNLEWPCRLCVTKQCKYVQFAFQELCIEDTRHLMGDGFFVDAPDGQCPPPLKFFQESETVEGIGLGVQVMMFLALIALAAFGGRSGRQFLRKMAKLVAFIATNFDTSFRRIGRVIRATRQIQTDLKNLSDGQRVSSFSSSSSSLSSVRSSKIRRPHPGKPVRPPKPISAAVSTEQPRASTPLPRPRIEPKSDAVSGKKGLFRPSLFRWMCGGAKRYGALDNTHSTLNSTQSTMISVEKTVVNAGQTGRLVNLSDTSTSSSSHTLGSPESKSNPPSKSPAPSSPGTGLQNPHYQLTPPQSATSSDNCPHARSTSTTAVGSQPPAVSAPRPSTSGSNPFRTPVYSIENPRRSQRNK